LLHHAGPDTLYRNDKPPAISLSAAVAELIVRQKKMI
jgi:hypothetical protein